MYISYVKAMTSRSERDEFDLTEFYFSCVNFTRNVYVSRCCGKKKNLVSLNFFFPVKSTLVCNLFNKCVAFTKFLPKGVRINFRNFHTVRFLPKRISSN